MRRKEVVVCAGVAFLGLLSAALAFAAEAKKVKVSDVQVTSSGQCIYPRSPALVLGLISSVSLMLAQAIINSVAGCICCKKHPHFSSINWRVGLTSFVISWVAFILAFLLLLTASALNDQRDEESMYFGSYCFVVKPGVFSAGAALALVSVALGIVYYVTLSTTNGGQPFDCPQNQSNIALGRPQVPPRSDEPVFVHEDTYNRRQFA